MMYSRFGVFSSFGLHVHLIFVFMAVIGAGLFLYWAVKNLSKDNLFKLSVWSIVLGVVGLLLTAGFAQGCLNGGFGRSGNAMMGWNFDQENLSFEDATNLESFQDGMFKEMDEHMGIEEVK